MRKDQYGDLFAHTHHMMCKGTGIPIKKWTSLEDSRNLRLSLLLDNRHIEVEWLLDRIMCRWKKYICQLRIYIDLGSRMNTFMSLHQDALDSVLLNFRSFPKILNMMQLIQKLGFSFHLDP
jgi:hypothetical protein